MGRDRLTAALRAWVEGYYPAEAAVELLIGHEAWIFRATANPDQLALNFADDETMAAIDWAALGRKLKHGTVKGSSGEVAILAVACSIGGGVPVDLRDALGSLGRTNVGLVARAVVHAGGYPDLPAGETP